MKCHKCNSPDTRVIDSRIGKSGLTIRRRRHCQECDNRFTTLEEIVREGLVVIKRDHRREDFDRNKMLSGISRACEKRPIDFEQIEMMISDIMMELENKFDYEIPSKAIGEEVMKKIKSIDQIAYVRFASVYKDFRDISELVDEISRLRDG